jgi:hypothetical protein
MHLSLPSKTVSSQIGLMIIVCCGDCTMYVVYLVVG